MNIDKAHVIIAKDKDSFQVGENEKGQWNVVFSEYVSGYDPQADRFTFSCRDFALVIPIKDADDICLKILRDHGTFPSTIYCKRD